MVCTCVRNLHYDSPREHATGCIYASCIHCKCVVGSGLHTVKMVVFSSRSRSLVRMEGGGEPRPVAMTGEVRLSKTHCWDDRG